MLKNLVFLKFLVLLLNRITSGFQPVTENDHVLVGHVFQQLHAIDWFSCIQACHDEPKCISYNYERSARANGLCELNDCGVEDLCDRDKSLINSVGFVLQQLREDKSEKRCGMNGQYPNTETPDLDLCKAGWTKNNSFCYKVFDERANFYQANSSCISEGAELVWIEDFDELEFLNTILAKDEKVFVGMTDIAEEGRWVWMDGSVPKLNPLWHGKHPDGGRNENCGEYQQKHGFHDKNCNEAKKYVCKYSLRNM